MERSTARVLLYTALRMVAWLVAAVVVALALYLTQLLSREHEVAQSLFARELRANERVQIDRLRTRDEWFSETCLLKGMPDFGSVVPFSGVPVLNRTVAAFADAVLGRDSAYDCARVGSACYEYVVDAVEIWFAYVPIASNVMAWVWCAVMFARACPMRGICGRIDRASTEQRIREAIASQINPVDAAFDRADTFGMRRRRKHDWPSVDAGVDSASVTAASESLLVLMGDGGVSRHGGM
jgi:hypothetical protein